MYRAKGDTSFFNEVKLKSRQKPTTSASPSSMCPGIFSFKVKPNLFFAASLNMNTPFSLCSSDWVKSRPSTTGMPINCRKFQATG